MTQSETNLQDNQLNENSQLIIEEKQIEKDNPSDLEKNSATMFIKEIFKAATYGWIVIWSKNDRRTSWFRLDQIDDAADKIVILAQEGDVFLGRGLQKDKLDPNFRGNNGSVCFVAGFFLDVDTQEGPHGSSEKPIDPNTLPDNTDTVLQVFHEEGLPEPTIVMRTGGGCHIHYLEIDPEMLDTDEKRESQAERSNAFQAEVRNVFRSRGWKLDSTPDLARLCKAAGTLNHKTSVAKPVRMDEIGPRVDRSVIQNWVSSRAKPNPSTVLVPRKSPKAQDIYHLALAEANERKKESNRSKDYVGSILLGCTWLKHCLDDAEFLSEPEWYAMIGIVHLTENGQQWANAFSSEHSEYKTKSTNDKIDHASKAHGPATCQFIQTGLGWSGCSRCSFQSSIRSPINLAKEAIEIIGIQKKTVFANKGQIYIDLASGEQFRIDEFTTKVRKHIGHSPHEILTGSKTMPVVDYREYRPGEDALIIQCTNGNLAANTWKRGGVASQPGDPSLILQFLERLIPDPASRNHVIFYIAHLLQHPGRKILHVITLVGDQGTGKTTLLSIVTSLIGEENVSKIQGGQLGSRFKEQLVNIQVLLIEEAQHGEKHGTYEDIKELVTSFSYNVEGKRIAYYKGRTPDGIFMTSNHEDPIVIPENDRRFAVFQTCHAPKNQVEKAESIEFFNVLNRELSKNGALLSAFSAYLNNLDLREFDPNKAPPMTDAKKRATEQTRIPLASTIQELISDCSAPFHKDIMTAREIADYIIGNTNKPQSFVNSVKVAKVLTTLGCRQVNLGENGVALELTFNNGKKDRVWAIRNHDQWLAADRSSLRAEYERSPPEGWTGTSGKHLILKSA